MTYQSVRDYEGLDVEIGAPYGRYWCNKRKGWFRVETDGRGGLVEFPEPGAPPSMLGLEVDVPARMRRRFQRMDARKENSELTKREIAREVMCALSEHGPMSKNELAGRIRVWVHQVNHALTDMKKRGEAVCYTDPKARGRKFLWRLT